MSQTDQQASKPLCWALVGPTACGKSAIAFELARRHPVEIVSVDSMQVYRGMDIGTAKPTMQERALVPHQMIDVLDPDQTCNVGWFSRVALRVIKGIQARGKRPFLVGGSALYLKGVIWGLMEGPSCDQGLRRRLHIWIRRLRELPRLRKLAWLTGWIVPAALVWKLTG